MRKLENINKYCRNIETLGIEIRLAKTQTIMAEWIKFVDPLLLYSDYSSDSLAKFLTVLRKNAKYFNSYIYTEA